MSILSRSSSTQVRFSIARLSLSPKMHTACWQLQCTISIRDHRGTLSLALQTCRQGLVSSLSSVMTHLFGTFKLTTGLRSSWRTLAASWFMRSGTCMASSTAYTTTARWMAPTHTTNPGGPPATCAPCASGSSQNPLGSRSPTGSRIWGAPVPSLALNKMSNSMID